MRVSEIGEFGLIELLCRELAIPYPPASSVATRPGFVVDVGDDALVAEPSDEALIWTTDTLVEGVHFLPGRTPWRNVGWKAIAVNVSDVAAMGGSPRLALVTLCLPDQFCVEDAVDLYRGMRECCDAYGVVVGGGDIVRSPVFTVTVAMSGGASRGAAGEVCTLTRGAARAGDVVAVTGTLGDSAAGVRLLASGAHSEGAAARSLVKAQERPAARIEAGRMTLRAGIRCGMDISDGLVQDAGHIARASGVQIRIEAEKVPLSPALRSAFPDDCLELALTGGEDYQLLLCGPRAVFERLIVAGLDLTIVGEAVKGEASVVVAGGADGKTYGTGGWDHFRSLSKGLS